MYLIKADLGLTDMEGTFLATAAFIEGRPFGEALFGLLANKFGRKPLMILVDSCLFATQVQG